MVLAISGIMFGPIVAIVAAQSRTPAKIASELKASRQIQKATLLLTEDASAALSFATGIEPDYGTFSVRVLRDLARSRDRPLLLAGRIGPA